MMAATIKTQKTAKILPFPSHKSVNETDRNRRLPTLSSAEIEDIFDHMNRRDKTLARAA